MNESEIKDFFNDYFKNTFIINSDAIKNNDDNYYSSKFIIIVMFIIIVIICLVFIIEIYQLTGFIFTYDFKYNYSNMFKAICGKEYLEFETPRFQIAYNILDLKILYDNSKNYSITLQIIKFFVSLIAILFINRYYSILLFKNIDIDKNNLIMFVLIYVVFILSIFIMPIYIFLSYIYSAEKTLSISKLYLYIPKFVFILVMILKIVNFSYYDKNDISRLAFFFIIIIVYIIFFYILNEIIAKISKDKIEKDNKINSELAIFNNQYNKFNEDNNILGDNNILNKFSEDIFAIKDSHLYNIYYLLITILVLSFLSYLYFTKVDFDNFTIITLKQYIILPIILLIILIFIIKFSQIFNTYINNYVLYLPYNIYKLYLKEINENFKFVLDNENNSKDDIVFKNKDNNIKINVANSILMILYNGIFEMNLVYMDSNPVSSDYININPEFDYYDKNELDDIKITYKDTKIYDIDYYLNNKEYKKNIFYNFNDCHVINNDVLFAIIKNTSISSNDVIFKDIEDNYSFKCINGGSKIEDKSKKLFSCLYKEYHKYSNANQIVVKFEKYFDISNVKFDNIEKYINIAIDNVNNNKTYNNKDELNVVNLDKSKADNKHKNNNSYGLFALDNKSYNNIINLDIFINKYKNFMIINFLDIENLKSMIKKTDIYDNDNVINNYMHYKKYIDELSSNLKIFFDYVNILLIDDYNNNIKKVSNNIISNYNNIKRNKIEDIYIQNNLKKEFANKSDEALVDFDERHIYIKMIIETIKTNIEIIQQNLKKINKSDTDNRQLKKFLVEFNKKNIEEYLLSIKKESFFDIENVESYKTATYLEFDYTNVAIVDYAKDNSFILDANIKNGYIVILSFYVKLHMIVSKMIDINNNKLNKKKAMTSEQNININTNIDDVNERLNIFEEYNKNIYYNLNAKRIIKSVESEIIVDYEDKYINISKANLKKLKEVDRLVYLIIFLYIIIFIIIYIVYRTLISLYYITKIKLE